MHRTPFWQWSEAKRDETDSAYRHERLTSIKSTQQPFKANLENDNFTESDDRIMQMLNPLPCRHGCILHGRPHDGVDVNSK